MKQRHRQRSPQITTSKLTVNTNRREPQGLLCETSASAMASQPEREPASPTSGTATTELSSEEQTKLEEYASQWHMLLTFREAKTLQDGLTGTIHWPVGRALLTRIALLERIDSVKEEYDKLQTENKLLQEWIGNSIQRNAQAKPRS